MIDSVREWLAAVLPIIFPLITFLTVLISLAIMLNRRRLQKHNALWNQDLAEIIRGVKDSIEFYSTHYAYLAAAAFTEDEILQKLAQLGPIRQLSAVHAEKIGSHNLNDALKKFYLVESQIDQLAGDQPLPPREAYQSLLGQLREAGDEVFEVITLLKR